MQIHDIQSGKDTRIIARTTRLALGVGAMVYRWGVAYRNRAFDLGRREISRAGVPVVCVGNLTTGGTGKTPVVCYLAKWLREQGLRVSIVSRGYGAPSERGGWGASQSDHPLGSGTNDEAMELADRLPDVPHVQDADRVEAARIAVEELETEIILMDDGFQHRRLHRDLDLVLIDATNPFGHGHLLPRGLLREPIKNLARASAVIMTRCDAASPESVDQTERQIEKHIAEGVPILRTTHGASGLIVHPDQVRSLETLANRRVVTLCAIGNPAAFEQTVRDQGAIVVDSLRYPDHAPLDRSTVDEIRQFAQVHEGEFDSFVCTHKDLVKLRCDRIGGKPVEAIQIDLQFVTSPTPLLNLIEQLH